MIAHSTKKEEALGVLEKWKEEHPKVVEHLQPADILTDSMRGRSSAWWRIRINLQHVPEELRPEQPEAAADSESLGGRYSGADRGVSRDAPKTAASS